MSTEKNLKNIISLMERDDSVDAPADSIRWASNLFRTRVTKPKQSLVKKLVAVLQMDIAPGKAAFGERSAGTGQARQMLFQAGDNAIDVRIEPSKKGFDLRGQILGEGFDGAEVALTSDNRRFETSVSTTGEFRFETVPAGSYELVLKGSGIEIDLKAIKIE